MFFFGGGGGKAEKWVAHFKGVFDEKKPSKYELFKFPQNILTYVFPATQRGLNE